MKSDWFKSSRSGANGASCVELSQDGDMIQVRDSKDRTGPVLTFTPAEWAASYLSAFEDVVRSRASAAAGAPSR